jgi:hypothetical protein
MKITLSIALLLAMTFTCAGAGQATAGAGWCQIYVDSGKSAIWFFYEDGRFAWLDAYVKTNKDGTVSAEESEDYGSRTGTWKMTGGKIETHEFWTHVGHGASPMHPVDEHFALIQADSLQKSRMIRLLDPLYGQQHVPGNKKLVLVRMAEVKRLQGWQIAETCAHAKEKPGDAAQDWTKFCTQ